MLLEHREFLRHGRLFADELHAAVDLPQLGINLAMRLLHHDDPLLLHNLHLQLGGDSPQLLNLLHDGRVDFFDVFGVSLGLYRYGLALKLVVPLHLLVSIVLI